MPLVERETVIAAPPGRCFDLSLSIEFHLDAGKATGEEVVGGVPRGLLGPGEEVVWRATRLGIRQELGSRITVFDRPRHFKVVMTRGAFARMENDHIFEPTAEGGTRLINRFDFEAPLGPLGRLAEALFLKAYIRAMLTERQTLLKATLESDAWKKYISAND